MVWHANKHFQFLSNIKEVKVWPLRLSLYYFLLQTPEDYCSTSRPHQLRSTTIPVTLLKENNHAALPIPPMKLDQLYD